jgi:hypothetical protein
MNEHDKDGENKPMKVTFAEGCFDDFDGTQEELDELVATLTEMAASGELMEKSVPVEEFPEIEEEVLELLPLLMSGNTRH